MNPEKLFHEFLRKKIINGGIKPSELEDVVGKYYEEWENTPCDAADGLSPREYYGKITDARELVGMLAESLKEGDAPPVITERLMRLDGADDALRDLLLDGGADEKTRLAAADLLNARDAVPIEAYIECVFDPDTPATLRETLIGRLEECGEQTAEPLIRRIEETDGEAKAILAELLVYSGARDERIYEYLMSLTDDKAALPFALDMIGRYGDERAIEKLTELARSCDYADFTDIRNAVEMLGGELEITRDFTDDVTYKKIKGEKK